MLCMVEISGEEIGDPQAKFGMNPCEWCERNWKLILQRYAKILVWVSCWFHLVSRYFNGLLGPQTNKGGLSTDFCRAKFNGCALRKSRQDRFISKMFLRGDSVILVLRNPKWALREFRFRRDHQCPVELGPRELWRYDTRQREKRPMQIANHNHSMSY